MSNLLIDFSRQIAISFFSGKFLKSSCLVAFFFFFCKIQVCYFIGNILTRGCRYLSLAQATLQHPASFLKIKDSQLTYLDMSFCVIKENEKMILDDILEPCHNLRKLSLEKVQDLTLNICTRIVQNAATITILNIGNCLGLCNSHGGVEAIITHCQNLEELNISWTDMKR